MIVGMPFLNFSNVNIKFFEKKLLWKSYTIAKTLLITKKLKLINMKKFVKTALNKNSEIFVIYVATLEAPLSRITIYPLQNTQIATLKQDNASIQVIIKYSNFLNIF